MLVASSVPVLASGVSAWSLQELSAAGVVAPTSSRGNASIGIVRIFAVFVR
jgi:hypothetical protein